MINQYYFATLGALTSSCKIFSVNDGSGLSGSLPSTLESEVGFRPSCCLLAVPLGSTGFCEISEDLGTITLGPGDKQLIVFDSSDTIYSISVNGPAYFICYP